MGKLLQNTALVDECQAAFQMQKEKNYFQAQCQGCPMIRFIISSDAYLRKFRLARLKECVSLTVTIFDRC